MCFGTGREVGARSLPVRASVDSTDLLIAKSTSGRKSCQLPQSTEVRKGVHTVRGVHVHVLACSRTSLYSRQDSRGQAEGSHAVCPSWRSLKPGSSRTREPVFGLVTIDSVKHTSDTLTYSLTHLLTRSLTHSLTGLVYLSAPSSVCLHGTGSGATYKTIKAATF